MVTLPSPNYIFSLSDLSDWPFTLYISSDQIQHACPFWLSLIHIIAMVACTLVDIVVCVALQLTKDYLKSYLRKHTVKIEMHLCKLDWNPIWNCLRLNPIWKNPFSVVFGCSNRGDTVWICWKSDLGCQCGHHLIHSTHCDWSLYFSTHWQSSFVFTSTSEILYAAFKECLASCRL